MKNLWHKALCFVLSLVIALSGALTAASAATVTRAADHRHVTSEVVKTPCGSMGQEERNVTCLDCCDGCEAKANTDCSQCLYCPVDGAVDVHRLPVQVVPEPESPQSSATVFPPTRPPTR